LSNGTAHIIELDGTEATVFGRSGSIRLQEAAAAVVNVLVDTSVWSLALRRAKRVDDTAPRELAELISEGRVVLLGPVRQELLSGIKAQDQFEKLRLTLRAFPDEPIHASDHESAAKACNDCRAKGIAVSSVDILICAVALSRRWSILTTDPDFKTYSEVLPLNLHSSR